MNTGSSSVVHHISEKRFQSVGAVGTEEDPGEPPGHLHVAA